MNKLVLLTFFSILIFAGCDSVKTTIGINNKNDNVTSATVGAPKDLAVVEITNNSIQFSWVNNTTDAILITVEKCAGAGCTDFAEVSRSPYGPTAVSHTETGLSSNTTYRFRLQATSSSGVKSDYLTSTDITTLLVPNTSLTVSGTTTSSISFSWVNNESTATTQVQRCNGTGCTNFADTFSSPLAVGVSSYTEGGLAQSNIYRFRIRAILGTGTSKWITTPDISTLPSAAPVVAAACTSPTTKVIDRGLKGSTTAVGRGLWSDTKIIPNTQTPATAYYDGSATGGNASLKISYWDGSKFNVEQIAGDTFVAAGSATWVKLAFLKVGVNAKRPIVVWTTGATTVKAAMRSAPLGTDGTWTATVIDTVTGATTRTASISVSPADHVGIVYTTSAVAAGKVRFIYCAAPCTSIADFTAMTAITDTVENSTQGANIQGIDTAWCKANSTTYYPAVVYHGNAAASIRYAICSNSNLATCKTAAGWTPTTVVANAAPVSMQMLIDPTVTGDTVKLLVKPLAGTALTTYTSSAACTAPTSFAAGANLVGAAASGTVWARLMRDAGGLYHVVANDATTMVYLNSNSSNLQTTTWNAAGAIETVAVPGLNVGAGGADIATSYGMIFTSYGMTATPFNLNMGVVNDITIPSNNASAVYYSVLPDSSGGINLPILAGPKTRNVSAASTSDSKPAVAYVDFSAGTLTGGRLKYAYRNGTTAATAWSISILPNVTNPLFPALAFDHNNLPWISFYDSNNFRFYLANNTATDGSGLWTIYQAPLGAKTASATAPATDDTAVAMYYNNGVAQPVLIFMNSTAAGTGGVRAIRLDPTTGQFGSLVTVDAMGASFGTRLSADFDASGNMVVAFYDLTTTTVRFNYSTNGGATWKPSSVQLSAATVGREGLSVKINPATSKPAISYYQASGNAVYLQQCTSVLSSCHIAGNWTTTTVQSTSAVGVSGITASTQEQMLSTSLTFSGAGVPYVSYMTGIGPAGMLPALAVTDATTGFTPTLPVTLLSAGGAASMAGVSAVYNGQPGANVSSIRNGLGQLISIHIGPNNWLYSTSCGD